METKETESTGLSLLKKGRKGLVHAVFSRLGLILLLLALQIFLVFSIFYWFESFLPHVFGVVVLFTTVMSLYLLNSGIDPTAKITWLVVILLFQPFGHGDGDGVAVQHSIQNVFLRYLAFNHFAVAVTGHTAEPGCWAFLGAGNIPLHNSPALFTIQHSSKRVF